ARASRPRRRPHRSRAGRGGVRRRSRLRRCGRPRRNRKPAREARRGATEARARTRGGAPGGGHCEPRRGRTRRDGGAATPDATATAESLGRREVGAVGLIGAAADAAGRSVGYSIFWARDEEGELEAARTVDRSLTEAPLAGVAVAVKDCIDVAGLPTTGGVAR